MVFKRTGAHTYAFQARLPNGRYRQLQTGAPFTAAGKALAQRIEAMWTALALEHRAWDLLEPVLTARRGERAARLGRLYDLWQETRYQPVEMRRLLSDVNLEPLVEPTCSPIRGAWARAPRRMSASTSGRCCQLATPAL
jgi:hypothetical protein